MYFPIFWRHFICKVVIRDTYWFFWGVFNGKFELYYKDPPKKAIRLYYKDPPKNPIRDFSPN